jgi:hypothetical protein
MQRQRHVYEREGRGELGFWDGEGQKRYLLAAAAHNVGVLMRNSCK